MLYDRIDESGGAPLPTYIPSGPAASPTPTATAPPVAPTPAADPSVTIKAGYTPDYTALLKNDPSYIAAQDAATASSGAAQAQRQARLRQLYIMYGGAMPDGFSDQFGDIDQATKDAAAQNQNSALARLRTNYEQGLSQFQKQLAARGMLQSGELNYGADQLQRGFDQQQYDAGNQFLNDAGSAYGQYLGVVSGNAQNMANAIGTAEQSVYSNPAYRPSDPVTATYHAALSAQYGQPIYDDGNGNYYDANGNPFQLPAASATPGGGLESSPFSWGYGGKQ